jgi:signal peptidase I
MVRLKAGVLGLLPYAAVCVTCFLALRAFPPLKVTGASMRPALEAGDVVIVNPSADVESGDIALFSQPGHGPVLHRVVAVENGMLTTKGDANSSSDAEPVAPENVGGIAACVIPFGKALRWWRSM